MLSVPESKFESLVRERDEAPEEKMRAEALLKRSEEEKGIKDREEEAKRARGCVLLDLGRTRENLRMGEEEN